MRTGNRIKVAGAVFLRVNCVGVKNTQFFAQVAPKVLNNGISIGSAPDEEVLQAEGATGRNLESESEAFLPLTAKERIKVMGFGGQELIEVKNP